VQVHGQVHGHDRKRQDKSRWSGKRVQDRGPVVCEWVSATREKAGRHWSWTLESGGVAECELSAVSVVHDRAGRQQKTEQWSEGE
jgi:hypothetical protein